MSIRLHLSVLLALLTAATSLFPSSAKASAGKGGATKASEKAKITATVSQPSIAELQARRDSLKEKLFQELLEKTKEYISEKEGYVDHPYLDTNGLIHIGYGTNVNNKDVFKALDLKNSKVVSLSEKEKEAVYNALLALAPEQKNLSTKEKHSASHYKQFAPCTLSKDNCDQLLEGDINKAFLSIRSHHGDGVLFGLSLSAQIAWGDMVYQRPIAVTECVKFNNAAKERNYDKMRQECTFKNPELKSRNEARQALLEKAKTEKPSTTFMEFRQAAIDLAQAKEYQRAEAKRAALEKAAKDKAAGI